jgi:Family of unknown function (DUF6445)
VPGIAFNNDAKVEVERVGQRGFAVTLIDNVLADPEGVAALGRTQNYAVDRSNLYPGMRALLPEGFSTALRAWLRTLLQREIRHDSSFFSVVTTARDDLLPIQRIPHYDSTDPRLLAAVIYLCDDARFSGTSFYRHRRTGYEEITAENQNNYRIALDDDMRKYGAPPQEYMSGDNALFEVIFRAPLRFNRAILYPGRALHAGNIEKGFSPPRDPGQWRLTITSLLHIAEKQQEGRNQNDRHHQ